MIVWRRRPSTKDLQKGFDAHGKEGLNWQRQDARAPQLRLIFARTRLLTVRLRCHSISLLSLFRNTLDIDQFLSLTLTQSAHLAGGWWGSDSCFCNTYCLWDSSLPLMPDQCNSHLFQFIATERRVGFPSAQWWCSWGQWGLRLPAGPRIILPQVPSIKNWPRSNFKSLGIELLDLKQILSGRGGKTWDEKKDGKGLPFLDVRSVGSFAVFGTMGGPASR